VQVSSQTERISVIRQIASQAASLGGVNSAQNTMTVQIHPEHWGQVTVSVSMLPPETTAANEAGNPAVTATLITSDPAVRDALAAHASDLSRALSSAGFHVDKVDVVVQATSASSAGQGMSGFHQGQSRSGGGFTPNSSGLSAHTNGGGSHQGAPFGSAFGQEQDDGQQSLYTPNGPLGQDDAGVNRQPVSPNPAARGRVDYRI
jgi:hypothetical protein